MASLPALRAEQGAGHGVVWSRWYSRRANSGPRLSHQQKALDEFLRDLHRRSGSALSGAVLLDGGRQEMAWSLEQATAGVWNECDCRLCVCRSDIRLARSPPHGRRDELAGIHLRTYIRATSRPGAGVLAICAVLRAGLLGGDVGALSQRHFYEDLIALLSIQHSAFRPLRSGVVFL